MNLHTVLKIAFAAALLAGFACGMLLLYNSPETQAAEAVERPLIPEWKPRVKEFTLDDGTRCVSVSTRATTFPQDSGFSGISCNWDKE